MAATEGRRRGPRAFALVIIVIVGAALVAIATAVVFTSGGTKILSTKTASFEHAQLIAEAGLERAAAYAKAVVRTERDFDAVLDPGFLINCSAPSGLNGSQWGVPRYTDAGGSVVSFPAGSDRRFRVTPFNGGAYLTRFDDDADDQAFNFNLGPFTGNQNASGQCNEGPAVQLDPLPAPPVGGATGGNNPFRDRNRAVWVTVIGIFPGTDPANARHQVTLRRFISSNERAPTPVATAKEINAALATQEIDFCAGLGDLAVDDNPITQSGVQACGFFRTTGNYFGPNPGTPPCAAPNARLSTGCSAFGKAPLSGPIDTTFIGSRNRNPFTAPTAGGRVGLHNLSSNCNFLIAGDEGAAGGATNMAGIYFWDAGGSRTDGTSVVACSAVTTIPDPSSNIADIGTMGSCWIPLLIAMRGDKPRDILGFGELDAPELDWNPRATAGPANSAPGNPLPGNHIWSGAAVPAGFVSKPAWSSCNDSDPNIAFFWNGVSGEPPPNVGVSCTGGCDSNTDTFRWGGQTTDIASPPADYDGGWHFDPSDSTGPFDPLAYVPGVYRVIDQSVMYGPKRTAALPADEDVRNNWPAITLTFADDITLKSLSGGLNGVVGVGTFAGDHPSIVVLADNANTGNDLTILGDWAFAGGVYADDINIGAAGVNSQIHVYGLLRATSRLTVASNSRLSIFYDNDLVTTEQETIVATPTRSRTLP